MPVSQGIHDPAAYAEQDYEPPSDMAWGPRGAWKWKNVNDIKYERSNLKGIHTTLAWDGKSLNCPENYEVRMDESKNKFVPNIANCAPRPKDWKVRENEHDYE